MNKLDVVAFGGGCFWCTEAVFLQIRGVEVVTPGYAGGNSPVDGEIPTYDMVSSGSTGHAEVIKIEYDPEIVSFKKLLEVFFVSHDPTTVNRQGNDVGTQYRSIVLYAIEDQRVETENAIEKLASSGKYKNPVVTEVVSLKKFFPAEEYHKNYYATHPDEAYSSFIIRPKVEKIKKEHADLLK